MSTLLDIQNLIRVYRLGKQEVVALRNLSLTVDEGEIVSLMGPSGCGKTTLINQVGGLDKPTAGSINSCGQHIELMSEKELVDYRRKSVGIIFQTLNISPMLTAAENVGIPMVFYGVPYEERVKRSKELLELVGLGDRVKHRPHELSGGERQRVAVAAALSNDPPLILADEPTGELDSESSEKMCDLFRELSKVHGKTMVIVTHNPEVAAISTKRILQMRDGFILGELDPKKLSTSGVVGAERMTEDLRRTQDAFPPRFCTNCGAMEIVLKQEGTSAGVWFDVSDRRLAMKLKFATCLKCGNIMWTLEDVGKEGKVTICAHCSHQNSAGSSFCQACGKPLNFQD